MPTEFEKLVESTVPAGGLRDAINELVAEKANGAELDRGPRIPVISDFISSEIDRLESIRFERAPIAQPIEPLNDFFQRELSEVFERN